MILNPEKYSVFSVSKGNSCVAVLLCISGSIIENGEKGEDLIHLPKSTEDPAVLMNKLKEILGCEVNWKNRGVPCPPLED